MRIAIVDESNDDLSDRPTPGGLKIVLVWRIGGAGVGLSGMTTGFRGSLIGLAGSLLLSSSSGGSPDVS
jgi:hypothetical protein